MSRHRGQGRILPNQFKIICTDRGQHGAAEIVILTDNRNSPTDEHFRELHEYLGQFSPTPVDDPVKNMASEHIRRSIQQLGRTIRVTAARREFTLNRALRFIKTPDGHTKLRLECPRCERDEQLGEERLDRLGDAMMAASREMRSSGVDMSYFADYLGKQ